VNAKRAQSLDHLQDSAAPASLGQIGELLATFRKLREQKRTLMARLRASLCEMQTLRDRLRRERVGGMSSGPSPASSARASDLQSGYRMTAREAEVAMLLAEGCSNSTVARRLGISPHTARHHTQRVLIKLGVHSRAEAGARLRR
jgi:DNA-binding CsgD family transcriptional regulator